MRKICLPLFLALCLVFRLQAQAVTFQSSNLPIVLINTGGQVIVDASKITATMKIIDNGPGQLNHPDDAPNNFNGLIGIEIRGSSSQLYDKKAYSVEVRDTTGNDLAVSLLGFSKESDFALISPLNDKTLLRDMLAYKFAGEIMTWAPHTRYVEVMLNGSYEGVYLLLEKIKRDKHRVDISKLTASDLAGDNVTGGYILSFDKYNGGVGGDWTSPYPPIPGSQAQTWYQVVYPKPSDIQPEQRAYIQKFCTDFEHVLYNWDPNALPDPPVYEKWIDTDSWIDQLLVNEMTKNVDAYRISNYFYKDKDSKDPRIHMGPVWDYNITFGIGDYCQNQSWAGWMTDFNQICGGDAWDVHFWWGKLLRDRSFQQRVTSRWRQLRSTIWTNDRLNMCIDSAVNLLAEPEKRNFIRWKVLGTYVWPNAYIGQTYEQEVDYLRTWFMARVAWMDGSIESIGPLDLRHFPYLEDAPVYPNPVTSGGNLTFKYNEPDPGQLQFTLYDAAGRLVWSPQPMPSGNWILYNLTLPTGIGNGLYGYRIERDGKPIKAGKLRIGN
jgi:hypothetical protein